MLLFIQDTAVDFSDATSILTWLMPIITLGITWLIKKIAPFISGTTTLFVVPLVSAAIAYLGTLMSDDVGFWASFGIGLGSVFLNQLYRHLTDPKEA